MLGRPILGDQMKTKLLDATEFKATFAEPMYDVLATATNVIDIWPYVAAIPTKELLGHAIIDGCVEHVYRNGKTRSTTPLLLPKRRTSSSRSS